MTTSTSVLATALTAAIARIDGVFDNPALVAQGPLTPSVDQDVEDILTRGIDQADALDDLRVCIRDLAIRLRQPTQRAEFLEPLKALAAVVLRTHALREADASPWKPIATAPKDRPILVACYGGKATEASYISDDAYRGWYATGEEPSFHDGPGENKPLNPDLWRELPVAPAKPA